MAGTKFVSSGDEATDKALAALQKQIPDLGVFEGARLIESTVSTSTRVVHGLRRKYRGFLVVGLSTAAIITDDRTRGDTDTYLYLTASTGTPSVRLIVF